jgi:hypothetical protein
VKTFGETFGAIPSAALLSEAVTTLPNYAVRVLLIAADQYRGANNGDIAITWAVACRYGLRSKEHLVAALTLLLERGLLIKTRQGGKRPLGPSLYPLGWRAIDDIRSKFDPHIYPTKTAPDGWKRWAQKQNDGTAGGPLRDCRRTVKRSQRDCPQTRDRVKPKFNGTAGSPALRSEAFDGDPSPGDGGEGKVVPIRSPRRGGAA